MQGHGAGTASRPRLYTGPKGSLVDFVDCNLSFIIFSGVKADEKIADWGAQRVTASEREITFEFYSVDGVLRDRYTLTRPAAAMPYRLMVPAVLLQ